MTLALNAPRIIRAYIDYKIDSPEKEKTEVLVREAINLGLSIYSSKPNVEEDISDLVKKTQQLHCEEIFKREIVQKRDTTTWMGTDPIYSQKSAGILASQGTEDLLFIALGHGGIAAGMDVFLRYKELSGSNNSLFYVVRCSRNKHKDGEPRVNLEEIDYLKGQEKSRKIIIFEEDSHTGKTIERADWFFSSNIFPYKMINLLVNRGKTPHLDLKK